MTEINLISIWPFKDDCPKVDLFKHLETMPSEIIENEPGTLRYAINIPSNTDSISNPSEIIFIETYANETAFQEHLYGPLFTKFRTKFLKYFNEDPKKKGWPDNSSTTTFLNQISIASK